MNNAGLSDGALAICYLISALVLVAVYREPLAALMRDVGAQYRAHRPARVPKVQLDARLERDIRDALGGAL